MSPHSRLVERPRPRSERAILDRALRDIAVRAGEAERAGASWEVLCAFVEAAAIITRAKHGLPRRAA